MAFSVSNIIHFIVSLCFGIVLSISFSGVKCNRQLITKLLVLGGSISLVCAFLLQTTDTATVMALYPLLVHITLALFLFGFGRVRFYIAFISIVLSYLFCQMPRWLSRIIALPFHESVIVEVIAYVILCCVFCIFILRYALVPIQGMLALPPLSMLSYSAVPIVYYVFDYLCTVYSDLLYRGNWYIVQLMPTVISCAYLLFIMAFYHESVRESQLQSERDLLDSQFQQSKLELSILRQVQEKNAAYRHDIRHHMIVIQGYAAEGNTDQILSYLKQFETGLNEITPTRITNNETVNLICSYYISLAKDSQVDLQCNIQFPDSLPIRDTHLCAILSNALENAMHAVTDLPEGQRYIRLKSHYHRNNILISVENPYAHEPHFKDGIPQSDQPGHGYGIRSMSLLVKENNGQLLYTAEKGIFRLQVMIPTAKYPTK